MRARLGALIVTLIALGAPPAGGEAAADPERSRQWSLDQIGVSDAWAVSTGKGVRIGIVDTGVDLAHEDLAGQVVAHTNCVGSGGDPGRCQGSGQDDQGHGTHVAGIAAAVRGNGQGVAGVAPDAELVVAKVLAANGSGSIDDVSAGIRWVVDHGAQVVNLSLGDAAVLVGGLLGGDALGKTIEEAWARGAVPVWASGNSNTLGLGLEGLSGEDVSAIMVGATGRDDRVTVYSTSTGNARWAVLAPGGTGGTPDEDDVYSTFWQPGEENAYAYLAGTSMAAPHVSGLVALLLAMGLDPQAAVERILATADTSVDCGLNSGTCRGRIDAARAVAGPADESG